MEDKGINDITSKFLGTGDLLALKFNQGYVFLEVSGWEQIKFAPYNEFSQVAPGESTGFSRLDYEGDDILFTEKRKKKVKHVAIGHSPSIMRRYTNYPEDEVRLRKLENVGAPNTGDDYGYISGEDSPYQSPTDAEELYIPPGVHLNFNFHNPDTEAHTPIINVVMRQYTVEALDPSNEQDANAIRRIMSPGSPIPIAPAGSVDRQINYDLSEFWGVTPVSEGAALNSGGGN